ncbi:transcriptional regulator [Nitrosospira lacus]|uniref:Transcription regulator PadR N-terminal domain-containing protein n=2 Tax=Nitrosospira lacus TaxID=1288494 RepID=A0A1W6STG8_9PROT|nr:transcriptional regulator [Nitrosospira lacus]
MFATSPQDHLSGADIRMVTGLSSGTLYPILMRFEDAGWLTSRWEDVEPSNVGRPRKRFYKITARGQVKTIEAFITIEGRGFA